MRGSAEDAWRQVTDAHLEALTRLLKDLATRFDRTIICEDATVHSYDLKNILSGNSERPHAQVGVRLFAYAVRRPKADFPAELGADYDLVFGLACRLFEFDANDDYLFRHLERMKVMTVNDCKRVAKLAHGNYYMYRLSTKRNVVFRSHVNVKNYTAFDRLPHFINRSKFGPLEIPGALMRRAEGQIFILNNTYIFIGFIFDNPDGPVSDYKGLKLMIIPSAEFHRKDVARGMFASFTHGGDDRYEYGPMCLVRTKEKSSATGIGEFPSTRLQSIAPQLRHEDLKINVAQMIEANGALAACLALGVFGGR